MRRAVQPSFESTPVAHVIRSYECNAVRVRANDMTTKKKDPYSLHVQPAMSR